MTSATAASAASRARGTGPLATVAEYFTLREVAEVSAKLPPTARTEISDALTLGRQKSDAADALWTNGHSAEGLRLAGEALEATLKVAPAYAKAMGLVPAAPPAPEPAAPAPETAAESVDREPGADGGVDATATVAEAGATVAETGATVAETGATVAAPPTAIDERDLRAIALRARGASEREIASIENAVSAFRGATLPLYDAQVSPAHGDLYQQVTSARHALDRRFATAPMVDRQILATRVGRMGTAALVLIAAAIATYFLTRAPEYTVHASSVWANVAAYDAEKAVDGRTDTWWLVPDGEQGWLEVRFTSPHDLERIRLLNTANAPHMDRGTNEYRVELYGTGGEVLHTIEGRFPHRHAPQWVEHAVDVQGVSRIRFVAVSHHRTSAGLTELQWQ